MTAIDASDIDVKVRLDLHDVPIRMMDAVIRRDADQYVGCFTEDGIWDADPLFRVSHGRQAIREAFVEACDGLEWAFQGHFHTIVAEYSGDRAKLRTYLHEVGVPKGMTTPVPIGVGLYVDDLVLVDGKWRITLHDLKTIYFGGNDHVTPLFRHDPA